MREKRLVPAWIKRCGAALALAHPLAGPVEGQSKAEQASSSDGEKTGPTEPAPPPGAIKTIQDALDAIKKGRVSPAGLRGNPAQFFGDDVYPLEAIRNHEQGRVVAKLWVDTDGHVASCTITQSSGSTALDHTTCDIALAKVVFEPAHDNKGKPIASSYTLPVRWVLPSGPVDVAINPPPPKWSMEMTMSVDGDGVVEACSGKVTPVPPTGADPCDQYPVGKETEFQFVRDGKPAGAVIKRSMTQEIAIDP